MKDFSEFRDYINKNCLMPIHEEVTQKIDEEISSMEFKNDFELFVWKQRAYNLKTFMKMLEEYHKWLNS